jgi:hypothetical protein
MMFSKKNCKTAVLSVTAMIALGAFTSSVSAQDIDARALLEQMSSEIAGLDSFVVRGDAYADARLDAGQIIEHASQVTLHLSRTTESVRITNRNAEETREVFFDNGLLSIYNSSDNRYAQTVIPKGIASMFDFAVNEIGIESPMLDFVSADVAGHLLQDGDEVSYLDTSLIRGELFHHIGIRSRDADIQIWIASEGRPLPGKLAISSKWEGGSPRFVSFFEWDPAPTFPPDLFRFEPPDASIEIELLVDPQ